MKKNIFLWSLYDFANSIIMIVFLFYFSQWLVVDSGKPDWWYNLTLVVSSLLFIVTAPVAGRRLDETRKKLAGVRVQSLLMMVFYFGTAMVTLFAPSQVLLAAILFTIAMYFYLMSFVYYTPMINDLSHTANRGWVSGLGQGANSLGQVFGLLVTLPFATGAITLLGTSGRAQTFLPALVLFGVFALPLILFYKEPSTGGAAPRRLNVAAEYHELMGTIRKIFSVKNFLYLFLAYLLFSDALLTFSNNFPILLEKVFLASDDIKTYLTAGILIISGVGSLIFGKVADRFGKKRTLGIVLAFWILFFPALAFAPTLGFAAVICLIAGLFFGPVWSISRALVSELTPKDTEARSFAFYTLAERFATFIGPLVWSGILAATASQGTSSYSYALVAMSVLVLVGAILVGKIRSSHA